MGETERVRPREYQVYDGTGQHRGNCRDTAEAEKRLLAWNRGCIVLRGVILRFGASCDAATKARLRAQLSGKPLNESDEVDAPETEVVVAANDSNANDNAAPLPTPTPPATSPPVTATSTATERPAAVVLLERALERYSYKQIANALRIDPSAIGHWVRANRGVPISRRREIEGLLTNGLPESTESTRVRAPQPKRPPADLSQRDPLMQAAVEKAGGIGALAKALDVPIDTVKTWRRVGIPSARIATVHAYVGKDDAAATETPPEGRACFSCNHCSLGPWGFAVRGRHTVCLACAQALVEEARANRAEYRAPPPEFSLGSVVYQRHEGGFITEHVVASTDLTIGGLWLVTLSNGDVVVHTNLTPHPHGRRAGEPYSAPEVVS